MLEWIRANPLLTFEWILFYAFFSAVLGMFILARVYKKKEYWKIGLFFFTLSVTIPFAGLIITAWLSIYLRTRRLRYQNLEVESIDLEPLYLSFSKTERIFGEGAVQVLLHNDKIPAEKKIKALAALQSDPNRYRLNIIKQALGDRQDEVRLFAFSIIDKFEKRLNVKIQQLLKKFEESESEDKKVLIARDLGTHYWDLVYFELSDPALQSFFIREAKRFTEYVLEKNFKDMPMHVLAGKIALKEGDVEKAEREFATVLETNARRYDFVAPYLAEIFYERHNYAATKALMTNNARLRYQQQLYPLILLWAGES